MAVEKAKTGRPRTRGGTQLENSFHELFVHAYLTNGWDKTPAYHHAYGAGTTNAGQRANRILARPEVKDRLRYLLEEESKQRITTEAIKKDVIEGRLWSVANRCMQHQKVSTPGHLRGRTFTPCAPCKKKQPDARCKSCQANEQLLRDWEAFGGVYKFDSNGVIKALLPLGRDRGLFIDKKLIGHMEGDEIIDAMNDTEIRELVRTLATEVGLRVVEARSESAPGTPPEPGSHIRAVS